MSVSCGGETDLFFLSQALGLAVQPPAAVLGTLSLCHKTAGTCQISP